MRYDAIDINHLVTLRFPLQGETDHDITSVVIHLFRYIVKCVIRMDRSVALLVCYFMNSYNSGTLYVLICSTINFSSNVAFARSIVNGNC